MKDSLPKLFVLDTNVILHDSGCIRNFEENDIAIPITVLEELDQFKRGNEDIHFQAREFLRRLDALTGDVLSAEGSPLGQGLGSIRVVLGGGPDSRLNESFLQDTPDHRILRATLGLQQQSTPRPVILVSKDTNLRMKAKSLGLRAQDYTSDKVQGFDTLYTGKRTIEGIDSEVINRLYAQGGRLPAADLPIEEPPRARLTSRAPIGAGASPWKSRDGPHAICRTVRSPRCVSTTWWPAVSSATMKRHRSWANPAA